MLKEVYVLAWQSKVRSGKAFHGQRQADLDTAACAGNHKVLGAVAYEVEGEAGLAAGARAAWAPSEVSSLSCLVTRGKGFPGT